MKGWPLPDFCRTGLVFTAMVVGQLSVLVAILAPGRPMAAGFEAIGIATLYAQWLVLFSVALLCLGRGLLNRMPGAWPWLGAWVVVVGCCLLLTAVGLQIDRVLALNLSPASVVFQEFLLQSGLIAALVTTAFLRYLWVITRWQAGQRARDQSRIAALQARIRPHFLFNTLNSIAALVPDQPDRAEEAIENLSDLFRGSLNDVVQPVKWEAEMDLVEKYLAIEALRLDTRLNVDWALDGFPESARILPFSLQLLVENAVRHGIAPRPAGGRIGIRGWQEGDRLMLEVVNPVPADHGTPRPDSQGMALENLSQRLALVYGPAGRLQTTTRGDMFVACMEWPA